MAEGLSAFSVVLGASLRGGWAATMGKAKGDLGVLGRAVKANRDLLKTTGGIDTKRQQANAESLLKSQKALDEYTASLTQIGPPTAEQAATLKILTSARDRHAKAMQRDAAQFRARAAALKAEGKDVAQVQAEYDRLSKRIAGLATLQTHWGRTIDAGRRLGRSLTVTGGVIAAVGGGLFALGKKAADYADDVSDTSERLGMSTVSLQEWRYAAGQAGIEAGKFDDALGKFSVGMDEAFTKRSGAASDALRRLGLDARGVWVLPMEKRLEVVADQLERISDTDAKASIMAALFGKDVGKDMNELLSKGSAAIAKYRKEAHDMGAVLSVEEARELKASIGSIRSAFQGVFLTVGFKLAPALQKFADMMKGSMPQIRKFAESFGKTLANVAPVLLRIMKGAGQLLGILARYPRLTSALVYGIAAFGFALSAVRLFQFGQEAVAVAKALWGLRNMQMLCTAAQWGLNIAMAANPIGAIVAGVLALVAAIGLLIWKWKEVNRFLDEHKLFGKILLRGTGIGLGVGVARSIYKTPDKSPEGRIAAGAVALPTLPGGTTVPGGFFGLSALLGYLGYKRFGRKQDVPAQTPNLVLPAEPAAKVAPVVNSNVTLNVTAQPGEDTETLAQRIAELIDRNQRGMLDSALADLA